MNVSVVIPVFNQSSFIADSLNSLLNQSVKADEIIVVDDGSTDDLVGELDPFSNAIKLIQLPSNHGVSAARNEGVTHSKNDIILFQDADDISLPKRIELCIDAFADKSVNIVQGMFVEFSDKMTTLSENDLLNVDSAPKHVMGTCVLAFRKAVFNHIGNFDLELNKGAEDLEWIMRAMRKGYKLTKIDQIFIRKRLHENNTSNLNLEDEARIRLKIFRKNFSKK